MKQAWNRARRSKNVVMATNSRLRRSFAGKARLNLVGHEQIAGLAEETYLEVRVLPGSARDKSTAAIRFSARGVMKKE